MGPVAGSGPVDPIGENGRVASGEAFESVLVAAQAGAEWAFAALYDDFNPRLLRYFVARAPRVADDLAAETWLGVAGGLRTFAGDEPSFRSWLFTIAHRRLVDHWRDQAADAGGATSGTYGMAAHAPTPGADLSQGPEEIVVGADSAQAAARKIASLLSPDQAEVILLRVVGGLDLEQVAEVLGKRPGTIRVLQHRALKKLAREISLEDVTG